MNFRNQKQKELERLRQQNKKTKENNRMSIIRNLREKNNEELRKYIEVEEICNIK